MTAGQHAEALRALAAEIQRDGLHGLPGTPLPVDHFGRAAKITAALDRAAAFLEGLAEEA